MVVVAMIGFGAWGKNLLRVFNQIGTIKLCCHTGSKSNLEWLKKNYPSISATTEYSDVLDDDSIDAVVIATPINTHYKLARQALEAEKHVFVEKPLTTDPKSSLELVSLSKDKNAKIFVGFVFLYHPIYDKIYNINKIDPIKRIHFDWRKTGGFTENILENLATHDVAMSNDLFSHGFTSGKINSDIEFKNTPNVSQISLLYDNNRKVQINLNRLSPNKSKLVTIVTESDQIFTWEKKTLWKLDEKKESFENVLQSRREPLMAECQAFVNYIQGKEEVTTDGKFGWKVTKVIDSLSRS